MEKCRPLLLCQFFQLTAVMFILVGAGKINISGHRLNIKSCAAYQDRNPAFVINFVHGIFCHLLKKNNVKIFCWLQYIHQMMWDAIHFFRRDLGGTDIHVAVNLHGVRGNDLSVYCFCKGNGKLCFSHGSRPGKHDKRFFHIFPPFMLSILHDTFEFFFDFCLTHVNDRWSSMRTVIRIFQCQ